MLEKVWRRGSLPTLWEGEKWAQPPLRRAWRVLKKLRKRAAVWASTGFPGGTKVKNPPANAGDTGHVGLIPGWGRSPGRGRGNPLHYSCPENPTDRGAWRATVHGVAKSRTRLKPLSVQTHDSASPLLNIHPEKIIAHKDTLPLCA